MLEKRFKLPYNEIYTMIGEGIDIDYRNNTVNINLVHEKGVDTSIENNPLYYKLDGIKIISIFKRKKILANDKSDGNPLLYALKGIYNWKIDDFNIKLLLKQFVRIVEKINPQYDTLIKVPSQNELNNIFFEHLNKYIKCKNEIIDIPILKISTDDVLNTYVDFKEMDYDEEQKMIRAFNLMSDTFTFKHIPSYLRKYIKKIFYSIEIEQELDENIVNSINDKDILILDDTVSSGAYISHFVNTIKEMYAPKSITVITLFSKL